MSDPAAPRRRKFINVLLWAAAVFSLAAAALRSLSGAFEYRDGYGKGLAGGSNFGLFESVFVALGAVCLWFAAIVLLLYGIALALASAQRLSAARIGLVMITVVATPLSCCNGHRGVDRFAHGFRDGLRERDVDWDGIRAWRASIPDAEATWMTIEHNHTPAPAEITLLHPSWVSIRADGTVNIVFGGGFMHWGIDVYSPNDPPKAMADGYLEVAPGVYCWAGE